MRATSPNRKRAISRLWIPEIFNDETLTLGKIGLTAEHIEPGPERDAAPEMGADGAGIDRSADGPDRALPAKVLMDHQRHASTLADSDHRPRVFERRCERLLADDAQIMARCEFDEGSMGGDRRRDIDEIQRLARKHFLRVSVARADCELVAHQLQPRRIAIADCNNAGAIDVPPSVQMVDREKTAPDQGPAKRAHGQPTLAV
jgi:hypothetical protein